MPHLGIPELMIILFIVILIFGANRLPDIGRGIGKGIRTSPRDAMIASTIPSEKLATAFGVHRAMDTAGAMLGPLIAAGLLAFIPGAFDAVFIVSFCFALVGVAALIVVVGAWRLRRLPGWRQQRAGRPWRAARSSMIRQ